MYNPNAIAQLVIGMLSEKLEEGVNLAVFAGPVTLAIPEPEAAQSLTEAATWRCPEMRPTFDLRIKVWHERGRVKVELQRIVGIAQSPADAEPFEVLQTSDSISLQIATASLEAAICEVVPPGTKLFVAEA